MKQVLQRKRGTFPKTVRLVIRNCVDHKVSHRAAALAYHFLFALFPIIIYYIIAKYLSAALIASSFSGETCGWGLPPGLGRL